MCGHAVLMHTYTHYESVVNENSPLVGTHHLLHSVQAFSTQSFPTAPNLCLDKTAHFPKERGHKSDVFGEYVAMPVTQATNQAERE